jgi:hypothetical protein
MNKKKLEKETKEVIIIGKQFHTFYDENGNEICKSFNLHEMNFNECDSCDSVDNEDFPNLESTHDGLDLKKCVDFFSKILSENEGKYDSISFVENINRDGYPEPMLIVGYRKETDDEFAARVKAEEDKVKAKEQAKIDKIKKKEEKEKKLLEELQKKFEKKE